MRLRFNVRRSQDSCKPYGQSRREGWSHRTSCCPNVPGGSPRILAHAPLSLSAGNVGRTKSGVVVWRLVGGGQAGSSSSGGGALAGSAPSLLAGNGEAGAKFWRQIDLLAAPVGASKTPARLTTGVKYSLAPGRRLSTVDQPPGHSVHSHDPGHRS